MRPELVAEAVRLKLIAPDDTARFLDPPPRRDRVDEAQARRAMAIAHSGASPGREPPRSPYTSRPIPAPPRRTP